MADPQQQLNEPGTLWAVVNTLGGICSTMVGGPLHVYHFDEDAVNFVAKYEELGAPYKVVPVRVISEEEYEEYRRLKEGL